jgi:hypothetical protein
MNAQEYYKSLIADGYEPHHKTNTRPLVGQQDQHLVYIE